MFFLRARARIFYENMCHMCHLSLIEKKGFLIFLDLIACATDHDEAATGICANPLKTKVYEGSAYIDGTQFLTDTAADDLQGSSHGHELAVLMVQGLAEEQVDELLLKVGGLKLAVVTVQLHDLFFREPILEAALVKGKGLTVDAFVRERMVSGGDDAFYLEGQPTAVARGVGQKMGVVARAAERGYVLAVLMIMGVGRSLVDAGHGDGCLELVQLGRTHGV